MEENYNTENNNKNNICFERHCWKKCLGMLCAAFLGGFLAMYFVTDQIMYKHMKHQPMPIPPAQFERHMFHDMDRMYKRDMKAFSDAFRKSQDFFYNFEEPDMDMPPFMYSSAEVKTQFDNDKLNIIVDLKPFQDNPDKVNYNVQGKKLTVFGKSEIKEKNRVQDISFSHDFILPKNADTMHITKEQQGHKLIISVPVK